MSDLIKKIEEKKGLKFDEEQIKIIEHSTGAILVVSTAGSGKSTILCCRLVNLIVKHNVDPSKILVLSYSNASVDDIK